MNESAVLCLDWWEMRQVRMMSESYSQTYAMSNNENKPPPYIENEEEYAAYTKNEFLEKMMEQRKLAMANQ